MKDLKIGDLVQLSAYGKKCKRANWVLRDDFGLVSEIRGGSGWYSYKVLWNKSNIKVNNRYATSWIYHERFLDRKDLKYMRAKKR
jgi:hypothetical protein